MRGLARGLLLWLLLAGAGAPLAARTPQVGDRAPDFELTLIDGSNVRMHDPRGQVVVLSYWATWCAPCRTELPILDGYYRVRRDAGLRVFAIATEGSLPV